MPAASSAPGRSALLTAKTSPISISPAFDACTPSPSPGTVITNVQSAVSWISMSAWPAPTVSMMTRPNSNRLSAATRSVAVSVKPPTWPREERLRK